MDVAQAVAGYISKMVSLGDSAAGTTNAKMKILLLDSETVSCPVGFGEVTLIA
jgi:vacuolar protein sorting-associated protein 45